MSGSSIDDFSPPPQPRRPTPPPRPQYRLDQGVLKGTRWLYDSEEEFQRAQEQLATEEAHEQANKERLKKNRLARAKHYVINPLKKTKAVPKYAAKLIRAHRKKAVIGAMAVVLGLITVFAFILQARTTPPHTEVLSSKQASSPVFPTIAPNADISRTLSGKIGYDPDKKVASYTDKIADIPVTVSQQALPERFLPDPTGELAKFAEEINAKKKLTAGDVTAYAGLSIKGPQTTVLIKNQLLIFIAAEKEIADNDLAAYIASLR